MSVNDKIKKDDGGDGFKVKIPCIIVGMKK